MRPRAGFLFVLGLALPCGACGTSRPVRYYTLNADVARAAAPPQAGAGVIGIPNITLPAYLDRPHIVTTGPGNRLILAEFDRWAEPLAEAAARVLADHLAAQLPEYRIRHRGWLDRTLLDAVISVDVSRFDGALDGAVTLSATWSVQRKGEDQPTATQQSTYTVPVEDSSVSALTRAMSRALGELAVDIARVITPAPAP